MTGESTFEAAVAELLAPVLTGYGLAIVRSDERSVRFESRLVWAHVFHEDDWFQAIGFHFGLRGAPGALTYFDVSHAMALVDPVAAARELDPIGRTPADVSAGVERLAANLPVYCAAALCGDADVYVAMAEALDLRLTRAAAWSRRARELGLNAALDFGDWPLVVEIYESAEQALTTLEERRLQVARQNARTQRACGPELSGDWDLLRELKRPYRAFVHQDRSDDDYWQYEDRVGAAMDAGDWPRVVELYEAAPYELGFLHQLRLDIARERVAGS